MQIISIIAIILTLAASITGLVFGMFLHIKANEGRKRRITFTYEINVSGKLRVSTYQSYEPIPESVNIPQRKNATHNLKPSPELLEAYSLDNSFAI
jgi:hypothetical protein